MTFPNLEVRQKCFRRSALWLALLSAPLAQAEPTTLEPIQVTADSGADGDVVVTDETIERFQANDLEDVFAGSPDVNVGGSVSIAQKVYVRGLEDPLLNVSVDGATQAGALFHHTGRLAVEPELLKQVEVETGAGRATAGAGALGGAIRFVTKDPEDLLREGENGGALIKLGSFSNTKGYKASSTLFGRLNNQWSTMVSVSQSDHERYEDGEGNKIAGNDSRQQLGLAKIVGNLPGDQTLKLSHEVRTDEGERTMRPQWAANEIRNRLFPLDVQRDTTTLNYGYAPASNPWVHLGLTTYHTESGIERDPENSQGMRYSGSVRSTGGDLRNTSRMADLSLVYGVDYREDKARARGEGSSHEEAGEVLGVYLQADYGLTRDLLLSAGIRYDDYSLEDAIGQTFDQDDVSPNASVAWEVLDGLTLKAGYAEAFRGATTHDTFKLYDARNDPELEGEKAQNTEVGFDYVNGGFSLSAEVYRSEIRDAIADPLVPWGEVIYTNIGDLESDGYLISTGYQWQGISAGLSFHSNEAEVDGTSLTVYEHNLMGNSIGDTWVADLAYRWDRTLEFGWQGRFVQGIDDLETSFGAIDKPGYGVHDIYAHWLPTGSDDLRLTLTVKNVGDKQYLDHASNADYTHIPGYGIVVGNPEPGRDIRFGLAMRF